MPASIPRRILRWSKRIALVAVALVVLTAVGALVILHTDWGREQVRHELEAQLLSSFPGGASVGRIEGSVLGELVLRDVELRAADRALFAKVGTLRVDLALLPLLGSTARIESLEAEDVEVYPLRTIAPPKPDEPSSPGAWSVELPAIQLRRAKLVIETAAQVVTLEQLDATARVAIPARGPLTAEAELSGTWRERGALVEGGVRARLDGERVELPWFDLRVGGVGVAGLDVVLDPDRVPGELVPAGQLLIDAPAAALRRLVPELGPELALPYDARVFVTAAPAARSELRLDVTAGMSGSWMKARLVADVAARRVRGVVEAGEVELPAVTGGALTGTGSVMVAVTADRARIRGTAIASGAVQGLPEGLSVASFDAALDETSQLQRATALVLAAGAGRTHARGVVELARRDGALRIETGRVAAVTDDAIAASGGLAPVRGRVALTAAVTGTIEPLAASLTGALDGGGVAYPEQELAVQRLHADLAGVVRGEVRAATGTVQGWVRGVARAGEPLGDADFSAALGEDRTIDATVTARPAAAEIAIVSRARITPAALAPASKPGELARIALREHAVTMPSGEQWRGSGGSVVVTEDRVTVAGVQLSNRRGRVELGATYAPETGDLKLALDARRFAAASIRPTYRGVAWGKVDIARRRQRWDGTVEVHGRGLVLSDGAAPFDGDLEGRVEGRRVQLKTGARAEALGGRVALELDVDGPRDLTDPEGWRRLERAAVRSATLGVDDVDLAAAAIPTGGVVSGQVRIAGAETAGTMTVRGVQTPLGEVVGDITFSPQDGGELGASSTARVVGFGDADVSARIAFPLHPFDPEAWQRLGRGALARLGASFSDIAIDPAKLAKLGITAPYRGVADISVVVADGATSASVELDATDVSGGPLVQPLDLRVTLAVDDAEGTRVRGTVHTTRDDKGKRLTEGERTMLLSFDAGVPSYAIDRWIAAPAEARDAPVTGGVLTMPGLRSVDGKHPAFAMPAPTLLAVFGRHDLAKGTIRGEILLGGTLGKPNAVGQLVLAGLEVPPRIAGRPVPKPTDITIDAQWSSPSGKITLRGTSGAGSVTAIAGGDPTDLAHVLVRIDAAGFDLAPLGAFLPGELAMLEGKLDAKGLYMKGLTSIENLRGSLSITKARIPVDPMLGTMRNGTATIAIDDAGMRAEVSGAIRGGTFKLSARSPKHDLASVVVTGKLDNIAPLGEWEPAIDATVDARFTRQRGDRWAGKITITNASAVLPESGSALGATDQPSDLLFVEDGPIERRAFVLGGRAPEAPWLEAEIDLVSMRLTAEDLFDVRGEVAARGLKLLVGDTVGLVGTIDIVTATVGDLFGRRYSASGNVTFTGSLQPEVHIALLHKFAREGLELTVLLDGDPTTLVPKFHADSGTYTQDQLAGFVLGGEPGGDASAQTREAAAGATAAVLSSALGRRIKKRLPIKFEQLGCDLGTSASAASCTVGKWFGEKLFVAFKRRLQATQENTNEGQGQYYLRRDLYLELVGGDAGSGGLDLFWRRRW